MIKALKESGYEVRGTVRDTAKSGEHVTSLGAEVFEVKDMSDATALGAAFAGVDGVFHMAAVHPEYGFAETKEGRDGILKCAVEGTQSVLTAAAKASVPRVVLTSSLAAVECGNDEGVLSEETWSRADVYDAVEKLEQTQWATHYSYVKSKVEQEKAALACAKELGLDMRVVSDAPSRDSFLRCAAVAAAAAPCCSHSSATPCLHVASSLCVRSQLRCVAARVRRRSCRATCASARSRRITSTAR